MKYLIIVFLLNYTVAQAESCKDGMSKFSKISSSKTQSICGFFKDPASFTEFKGCVLSTAKQFDKNASDDDITGCQKKI